MAQKKSLKSRPIGEIFISSPHKRVLRHIPAMPIEAQYIPAETVVAHECQGEASTFRFRVPIRKKSIKEWFVFMDVYSLRNSFLSVKTAAEAHSFLSVAGHLRYTRRKSNMSVTWEEFQIWQKVVRRITLEGFPRLGPYDREMSTPPKFTEGESEAFAAQLRNVSEATFSWLQGMGDGIRIGAQPMAGPRDKRPCLEATITVVTALDAILASTYMDSLQGINYRLCELHDCNTMYEVTSSHVRKFCSQYCAHKASIRQTRAAAKAVLETKTRSGAGQKSATTRR